MTDIKQCPVCGERLHITATKCSSCGYDNSMETKIQYTITVTPPVQGTITGVTTGDKYPKLYGLVLTATPNALYHFTKWTIDGVDYTSNPKRWVVMKAHTIAATFTAD